MGRSPREIEDQVTYPLSRKLQGLAGVKAVRSSSEFNFSMITIIFEDGIDFYFARQRVTEKLGQASTFLPAGVVPYLAPDATALGQIFWYTVEPSPRNPIDPGRLWALNKFYIAPQLNAAAGRGRCGRRRRHAAGIPDRRAAGGPAGLRRHARRAVRRGRPRATCRPAAASSRRTTPSTSSAASAGSRTSSDIENTVIKEVERHADLRQERGHRAARHAVSPQRLREGRQRSRRRRRADAARREPAGRHRARQGEDPGAAAGPARRACTSSRPTTARG